MLTMLPSMVARMMPMPTAAMTYHLRL
jgi:hypothetical protein